MHPVPMHEPRDIKQVLAANLLAARKRLGLTQTQVAERIGATQDQVSRWERGDVVPGLGWQTALAGLYFDGDLSAIYRVPDPEEEAA